MKKTILFKILILLCTTLIFATNVTIVGDNGYPPYSFKEGNVNKGIYTEVLKKAFSRMEGFNVDIELVPWKRAINGVKDGTMLAVYPPYYHPQKRPFINPYSEPILEEEVIVLCNKNVDKSKKNWPKDFHTLKVGVNSGYQVGGKEFLDAVKNGQIVKEEAIDNKTNLKKLLSGRIDCYVNDKNAILYSIKLLKEEGVKISISDFYIAATASKENGYLGFSKTFKAPWKNKFISEFKKIIIEMKKNGEIDNIINSYKE